MTNEKMIAIPEERYYKMLDSYDMATEELYTVKKELEVFKVTKEGGAEMKAQDLQMELAKTQATLNNLIEAVRRQEEGKGEVDVLGSLLALKDQLNNIDSVVNELYQ